MRRNAVVAVVSALIGAVVATPVAVYASHQFNDVPESHTFHDDIGWLADAGITKGCNPPDNDEYCPDDPVTRGQMAAFMRRLAEAEVVNPVPPEPYTAGNGIDIVDKNVRVETPLTLSGNQAPSPDPKSSSILSVTNTNTDGHPIGDGSFAIYGESNDSYYGGAGVMGRGNDDGYGVLGEAGDTSNAAQGLGPIGVVGMGEQRGVHAASENGLGLYGTSVNSTGVYGNTSRIDHNYGLYTNDNLFSFNVQMSGAMMLVVQNGSGQTLEKGDVVSFSGVTPPGGGRDAAIAQVSKTGTAGSGGIAGVVYSRFDLESALDNDEEPDEMIESMDLTSDGPVEPGEHLLLVVMGPAQVKVDPGPTQVTPGTALGASSDGAATSDQELIASGVDTPALVGTALEPATDSGLTWVFVGSD